MVNPAVELNARFSPLVVSVELYVCTRVCVRVPLCGLLLCMSKEGSRRRDGAASLQSAKEVAGKQEAAGLCDTEGQRREISPPSSLSAVTKATSKKKANGQQFALSLSRHRVATAGLMSA